MARGIPSRLLYDYSAFHANTGDRSSTRRPQNEPSAPRGDVLSHLPAPRRGTRHLDRLRGDAITNRSPGNHHHTRGAHHRLRARRTQAAGCSDSSRGPGDVERHGQADAHRRGRIPRPGAGRGHAHRVYLRGPAAARHAQPPGIRA